MYKIDKTIIFNHDKPLKDQLKILAPALLSIWNEFQNHIQMTGNLNVYYLVRDKLNFVNNSMRSSLDFTVVEANTFYLYHFWCKGYVTWTDLSIKCFKLHEYEYLDRIHIVPSQTNILSEEISKRNLNLLSSEYIVSAKYFLQDKQETSKLYPR